MVTAARVQELLSYDPATGEFRWKVKPCKRMEVGSGAGWKSSHNGAKYCRIRIDGKSYYAHRIAWLISHGEFPAGDIDHIDGNGLNNKLENLRVVSHAENLRNQRKHSNNTSGVSGVSWQEDRQRWHAYIHVNHKRVPLGRFTSKDEAIAARKAAEAKYGFHENHGTNRSL